MLAVPVEVLVCMSRFLYTEVSYVLSGPAETKVSNKGMDPSLLGNSGELYVWVNGINVL